MQDSTEFNRWIKTHKPFHWFLEFNNIMNNGGFDVVIGNPPYVEYARVKDEYTIKNFYTEKCGNLYAFVIEKSLNLINKNGRFGMIVPISLPSTNRMHNLRKLLETKSSHLWCSNFSDRPGTLFTGVHQKYLQ
ncbi:unnamed protein product [marine sediment metagenome]|uniref:site-specific DNA-methyltransferase (adenine-specific) n=1 Tax=marine sediment metagenome TaxID=412755 RepID=X1GJR0_9ZZZZ